MGMAEYEEALALVRAHRHDAHFSGQRDEALIAAAEAALGVTFPPIYRRFVRELGAGSIGAEEVYGVTSENFTQGAIPNGIWITLQIRSDSELPASMIVIYDAGESEYFVLDTSHTEPNGECPVVMWYPNWEPGHGQEIIAPDFGTFFLSVVQDAIAGLDEDDE